MSAGVVYVGASNVVTPLGFGTDANFRALLDGKSGIQKHQDSLLPQPYFSSTIPTDNLERAFAEISPKESYSKLEKMLILALHPVVMASGSAKSERTGFILSTTKGNINALEKDDVFKATLHDLAKTVADFFGFTTQPVVLSNACVSGIMAVSVGKRMMQSGQFDEVFVVAGDLVSEFVLSGFNSFQAMSDAPCKPYSLNRTGVTLGEAAAAIHLTLEKSKASAIVMGDGSMNDANHISGPSRTGEGLLLSVESALEEAGIDRKELGFISAHGTATPFNDEMEAIAFNRAGLESVPLHSLKGYYGHTLGASGLLETVIGIEAMKQGKLIASAGFDDLGVSQSLNVIGSHAEGEISCFLKTASGFGGCNTAVVFGNPDREVSNWSLPDEKLFIERSVSIANGKIISDGERLFSSDKNFTDFAKDALRFFEIPYPKFFKMDALSKLAFLASEVLLQPVSDKEDIALLLSNASSSLDTDLVYQSSISNKAEYFPSPAVFVYTLPNICLGEISIRHQLKTENSFFIFGAFNPEFLAKYAENLIQTKKASRVLLGWTELLGEEYNAFVCLVSKQGSRRLNLENLNALYTP